MDLLSLDERRIVAAQLGRTPRGRYDAARRCSYGVPQVLRVYPMVDGLPFPTLYWLTCPHLGLAIDRLEAAGEIGRIEAQIASDDELRRELDRAHDAYIAARAAVLDPADRRSLEASGRMGALSARGIGGISDRRYVKCLHLHVAHALVGENPVGRLVLDSLETRECESCACSALLDATCPR